MWFYSILFCREWALISACYCKCQAQRILEHATWKTLSKSLALLSAEATFGIFGCSPGHCLVRSLMKSPWKTCVGSWCAIWPFDLSLRPIFKIHYGLISRQNLSTQPWSTWVCDPVTGTRRPRNGRRRTITWSGSPNHLCTDTSDTSYTPPKIKHLPRPTTLALATMCQWRSWMMTSTSSMFRWGAVVLCSFLLLQTSNPAKAASCNSVLALIKSIILIPSYSILFLSILGRGRMKHPHLP